MPQGMMSKNLARVVVLVPGREAAHMLIKLGTWVGQAIRHGRARAVNSIAKVLEGRKGLYSIESKV